jgi:hypothetical protein
VEIILNLAWALCSLGLFWIWARNRSSNPAPFRIQFLALAMVVLLLLPIISLSDDLLAMQGPAETDNCVRRALHADDGHPSVVPASMGMPEALFVTLASSGWSRDFFQTYQLAAPPAPLSRSLDSRPPPQA